MMKSIYIKPDTGFVKVGNISDLMEDPIVTESRWRAGNDGGKIVDLYDDTNEDGTGSGNISFNAKGFFSDSWDNDFSEYASW